MIDLPGFADPVSSAQATFRAVLDAMSRPGTVKTAGDGLTPPSVLQPAMAAVLLTLVDADTPVWLDPRFAPARDWIAFHCGAPFVDAVQDAAFVVTPVLPDLMALNDGSDDGPETAATVILGVPALDEGASWILTGPGLCAPAPLLVTGLPADFAEQWAKNHARFPRGIDLVLCAEARLAALPRSVSVQEG